MAGGSWALQSAEDHARVAPTTFLIPRRSVCEALTRGDGAKLLFGIEARESDRVVRNVERMWVVVKEKVDRYYVGVLTNAPAADHPTLKEGCLIVFGPEHVAGLDRLPDEFICKVLGS